MANRILAYRMLDPDFEADPALPHAIETGGAGYQEASSPTHHTRLSKFANVLTSFKTHLSQEDMDRFKVATFNDLKSVVKDIQTEQACRKSFRNMAKIRPYLDGLQQYAAVIEVFVNSKPDILAFIWGPIKFCLKIASNFSDAFDALLDAYKQIGDALPIFSDINDLFSTHSSVQQVLVNVYEDILDFHGRAVNFFKQRAWKITMKLAFRTFRSMFGDVLENLERSKGLLYQSADIAGFREAQDSRSLFKQQFDAQERKEMNDRRSTALEWLSHESCDKSHEELQETRRRFPSTTRWIFQERAWTEWLGGNREKDQPFWISGIPGAGKTVLFSSIVDEIRTTFPQATIVFFYCKYNNVLRNSYQEVVKSLIAQLLYNNDDCLRYLYDKAVTVHQRHPSTRNVLEELIGTMARLHHDLFIGIDGIDECEPSERQLILSLVHNLLKLSDTELDLKIFLASCTEKDIEESLKQSTHLALNCHHLDSDVRSYIDIRSVELGKSLSLSGERVHEVVVKVADRPEGMFLLARLIMDNLLDQETWEDVDEELRSEILPRRIDEAYGRILLRIRKHKNARQQARVKQILEMITVAKRSLWLHEIQGALSIRLDDKSIDLENRKIRKHLKEICGPIVEVHEDGGVELIHHTAKTFLEQTPSEQFISPNTANKNMVRLCMSYLTFDCITTELDYPEYLERVKKGDYAFLEYSICYWIQHMHYLQSAEERNSKETKGLLDLSREVLDLHYEVMLSKNTPKDSQSITLADQNATWERLHYVQESFEATCTIANDGEQSEIPKPSLYRLLLHIRGLIEDASEEPLSIIEAYGRSIFKCPMVRCKHFHRGFHSRAQRDRHVKGHERSFTCTIDGCVYQVLGFASKAALNAHVSSYHDSSCGRYTFPNVRPRSIWKALEHAIDKDDAVAVRALCEEGANLPKKESGFLLRAVQKKRLKATPILVELFSGDIQEMDHQDRFGRSALYVAAETGEEDLVQLISRTSASVNRQGINGRSPICIASANGHLGIVQLLLQHDKFDMNLELVYDDHLNSPLFNAARAGHLKVVQELLENNAEQYVERNCFIEALKAAGASRHESIVNYMLEKGATVNAQKTYDQRLAAALIEGVDVAADLLLQRQTAKKHRGGFNEKGKIYSRTLQAAALEGDEPEVKRLLDQGVDINNGSGGGNSALQAAASKGHRTVVQLLLDNGADVNATEGYYGSALQPAAFQGDKNTVQLLLNNGADVNATGGHFGSALQAAASQGHKDTVQLLLNNGADVNVTGEYYGSALQAAASQGHKDTVQLLLNNGADVNATGGHYGSALQAAAYQGYKDTVQLLLNNGADVNVTGEYYGSALQPAAFQGDKNTVQLLLNNGADVNATGGHFGSALQAAAYQGHKDTVQLLLNNGADVNATGGHYGSALQAAAYQGYKDTVQLLLNNGADVNATGGHFGSALQAAASQGHKDTVQLLLNNGADVNATGGHFGSALQAAASQGHNATWGHFGSALQAAASQGHKDTVQLLLRNGADVNATGGRYGNALQAAWASKSSTKAAIVELLEAAKRKSPMELPIPTSAPVLNSSISPQPWLPAPQ